MYIVALGIGIIGIIFLLIGLFEGSNEKIIKQAQCCTEGTVVRYCQTSGKPPMVEYEVDSNVYRRAMRYTVVIEISKPSSKIEVSTNDVMATTLRINKNSKINANTIMRDNFPIGSKMKVYYDKDKPQLSYVARYAKNIIPITFNIVGIFIIVLAICIGYVGKIYNL